MSKSTCKDYFDNLAARVCEMWHAERYDELAFSNVAQRALTDDPPNAQVSFIDAVKYGFFTYPLPRQEDLEAIFGDPPLTVYSQADFRIEVLFWLRGLTAIHQHAFSGAFHVMEGSSLHTSWDFQCEEKLASRLLLGQLKLKKAEYLRAGDTRPIIAGKPFIHATCHLDRPTVSVVIRTNHEKAQLPQYTYLPPSVAYEPIDTGPRIKRHIQLLRLLNSTKRYEDLIDVLFDLLESENDYATLHYLLKAYDMFEDETNRDLILSWAARKHSRLVEAVRPALMNVVRSRRIERIGEEVIQPDLQYFMNLLLNIPRREDILNLIRERYADDDPIDMIIKWMGELSRLNLDDVNFPEAWLEPLRSLLNAAPTAQTVHAISAGGDQGATAARRQEVEQFSEAISNHWLLRSLFA
ncbi:MAG TPA: hypothetical protein VF131_10085 [Blastocatellia bacterium]|nr:hypothetical protein [Blastocatellia bacterium]